VQAAGEERKQSMTLLSVNINKVALIRNSRGRNYPDVTAFAARCLDLGAAGSRCIRVLISVMHVTAMLKRWVLYVRPAVWN
jgi:hypothetical protein